MGNDFAYPTNSVQPNTTSGPGQVPPVSAAPVNAPVATTPVGGGVAVNLNPVVDTVSVQQNTNSNIAPTPDVPSVKPMKPEQLDTEKKSLAEELDQKKPEEKSFKSLAERLNQLKSEFVETKEDVQPSPTIAVETQPTATQPTVVQPTAVQPVTKLDPLDELKKGEQRAIEQQPVVPEPTVSKDIDPVMGDLSTPAGLMSSNVANDTGEVKPLMETTPSKGGKYPFTIEQLLEMVIERNASDIHINVGYPVNIRVDGTLIPVSDDVVTVENATELISPVLDEDKRDRLEVNREVDLAYAYGNKGRFRINAYHQKQTMAAAFRLIPTKIRTIEELNLPQIYHQLTKLGQGLVLVTGPTGHGKSTTLAAMIQQINHTRACHILTIEDPIEYVFPAEKAFVSQREIFDDTNSWEIALKSAMREDPNVILVGEMRDFETISAAITLAETGHLVFATLHTNNSAQTIDRIIDVFPENQQAQVRSQLSSVIEAVVAQRLVPLDGGGRKACSEIMIANPAVRNLIREAKTYQLDNVIRTSSDIGMISLEQSLVKMVREGLITMEKAMRYAVRPEEIVRLLKE